MPASHPSGPPSRIFYGWYVLASFALVTFFGMGCIYYGAGFLNAQMARELGFSRSELGLGFTCMFMVQGLLGPFIALVLHRVGLRAAVTFGLLMLCGGALLMALWVELSWQYAVTFGVMFGLGMGFSSYIPSQTAAAIWFDRWRALASASVLAAGGIGGILVPPLLGWLTLSLDSWRNTWLFVATAMFSVGIVASLVIRSSPSSVGQRPDGRIHDDEGISGSHIRKRAVYRSTRQWTLSEALRTRTFWIIILCEAAFAIPMVSFFAHAVVHLEGLGHPPATAALALSVVAIGSLSGSLSHGLIGDRFEPNKLWSMALLSSATGMALFITADNFLQLCISSIMIGFAGSAGAVCKSIMISNYFGPQSFGRILGSLSPPTTIMVASSPSIVGMIFDASGTYFHAFALLATFACVTALVQWRLRPPAVQPSVRRPAG